MNLMAARFVELIHELRACRLCEPQLPLGARPIFQLDPRAPILLVGQAPGRITHAKGIPFDDPSGTRLREWLGVTREEFYDPARFAILPMGLCFPGTGSGGDLPPRPECARTWRARVLAELPQVKLTLVIGQYAQEWHLKRKGSVSDIVTAWREFAPSVIPLPHPSPRNQRWLKDRPWFELELLPELRARVAQSLSAQSAAG
jgi:uracil-DNA glycosylase